MNEDYKESEIYQKLGKQEKAIMDGVMSNLGNGSMWKQGWESSAAPVSIRGKSYHGSNNLLLTLVSMQMGYSDNRWVTYNQMQKEGWSFKTDDAGKSMGKNKGIPVSFFELRDRETKQPFDRSVLDGMSADEKEDYMHDNVYPLRKTYIVFNGDIIDGIPEKEVTETAIDETARNERVERLLEYWNDNEAKILYGGSMAYYSPSKDEIHLPKRNDFYNYGEFYSTALHETSHSTGHEKRLNRDMSGKFGSADYATEELRAEIASMFLCQEFGVPMDESHIQNNSAYVNSWYETIKENPTVLFAAISDADKMSKYITAKEKNIQVTESKEEQPVTEEKSEEFIRPSEIAARAVPKSADMTGRGVESLMNMEDWELVEKAKDSPGGDVFMRLFNGGTLFNDEEKDERSLLSRILMLGADEEQAARIFRASGQYRDEKPNAHYAQLMKQSAKFVADIKKNGTMAKPKTTPKARSGANAKT